MELSNELVAAIAVFFECNYQLKDEMGEELSNELAVAINNFNSGNYREAVESFNIFSNEGNPIAQYYLGLCYENGFYFKKEMNEAEKYYRKAADQGLKPAIVRLSQLKSTTENEEKINSIDNSSFTQNLFCADNSSATQNTNSTDNFSSSQNTNSTDNFSSSQNINSKDNSSFTQNTNLGKSNDSIVKDIKVEEAIKYFGLEGFPLPKEIEEHIVDLAYLEKMLDEINSRYEISMKKIGEVTDGVVSTLWKGADSFSVATGDFTEALYLGRGLGEILGGLVGGAAATIGSVGAGIIGGAIGLGAAVAHGVTANKAASERYKVAEAKIDNIKSVIPTLNKPGYRLMYEQEMKKTISISDISREKKEQVFRFSLFLYAKTEYLKKLAEYFVDTFEAWLEYKEKGSLEAPVFINYMDNIVNTWELSKTLVDIQGDVMPLYLVVALKDPFIASRYINMDSNKLSDIIGYDIIKNKGFIYMASSYKRYELSESACTILSENPLYINYKKLQMEYPETPKKVTFIDIFLYLLMITLFAVIIYFLPATIPLNIATGSKKFGFIVICVGVCLLTPWFVSFLPVTTRLNKYKRQYKEHYEKIQDTFRKAEKDPVSLITVNRR